MEHRYSRRAMMKMSAGALLALNLWPGRLRAAASAVKPLKFIVVNDFHFFNDACVPFFQGLVKGFNATPDAAMVLIVGDLIHSGTMEQAQTIRDLLKPLKMPYHVTPGNHDAHTLTDRTAFDAVFGTEMNVTFAAGGWQFVGLDTSDGTKASDFDCHPETLEFAASLPSKLDPSQPTFLYTHFPLGPGVKNRLKNADALLEPLKVLNLAAIFNGHYHAFTEARFKNSLVTTNRCCSRYAANHDKTWQKGYFIINAADGAYSRTFVDYGTDYPGAGHPAGTLPATRPTTGPVAAPWY